MYVPDPDKIHEKKGKIKDLEWHSAGVGQRKDRFHKIQIEWYRY